MSFVIVLLCATVSVVIGGWRNEPNHIMWGHINGLMNGQIRTSKHIQNDLGLDYMEILRLMQILSENPSVHNIYKNPMKLLSVSRTSRK